MKLFLIIVSLIILIIAGACLVRVSLRVSYYDSLKAEIRVGGIPLDRLLGLVKKKKEKKPDGGGKKEEKQKEKKPLFDSLGDIAGIINAFASKFFGHVRVRLAHIVIRVGTDDPAKTAVRYGLVIQSVAYITEILKRKTKFTTEKNAVIDISPDFISDKTVGEADIRLSVSLGGVLHSFICAAIAHLKK